MISEFTLNLVEALRPIVPDRELAKSFGLSIATISAHFGRNPRYYHKGYRTPEYGSWRGMKDRCGRARAHGYEYYGGRGITVCSRWKEFKNFLADMGPRPSLDHSLDRIDNNGNYEPGNCRWATRKEQHSNQSKKYNKCRREN